MVNKCDLHFAIIKFPSPNNYVKMSDPIVSQLEQELKSLESLLEEFKISTAVASNQSESKFVELGELEHRVVHFKQNPSKTYLKTKQTEIDRLKKENSRLRARLALLESGSNADVTIAISSAIHDTDRIVKLKRLLDIARAQEQTILDGFRKDSLSYKEFCYLLTGWRIDALKDGIFRLTHMYAESENDVLIFEISSDQSQCQLLETEYSNRLSSQIETYLVESDSFPAFLAAITLDLFKSTTLAQRNETMSMSMSMSTTILPNPSYNKP